MRILFLLLILSACSYPPPKPQVVIEPIPIVVVPAPAPDEWEAATIRRKPVRRTAPIAPPVIVIPKAELLPPCPPETGDKQKDLLRLLNCAIETADKTMPPPVKK